jgi:hypothetical protein
MRINTLDHLALTAANIDRTIKIDRDPRRMKTSAFDDGRTALNFNHSKINPNQVGYPVRPNVLPTVGGSVDLCLITDDPLDSGPAELDEHRILLIEEPVHRYGAFTTPRSVYVRGSGNLVEILSHVRMQAGCSADLTALAPAHSAGWPSQGMT